MKLLKERAALTRIIRNFFTEKDYLEVDTPVVCKSLIPEACLEVFRTEYFSLLGGKHDYYLIPSPEIWMKKLLAKGCGNIFQITKSFRNFEPSDKVHNPEFTMLEWYTVLKDYKYSIGIMQELLDYIKDNFELNKNIIKLLENKVDIVSMKSLFLNILNMNLDEFQTLEALKSRAVNLDISICSDDTWESLFNKLFLNFIEPELARAVIICDYPSNIPCLAKSSGFYSERWELYINGVEIANCYTEETDKTKVERFFRHQSKLKGKSLVIHPSDKEFIDIFNSSFPECTGVALGMERLFMVLLNINSIDGVISFPFK
jgi:elongation factor P--(R)-beta-lysine ligase